MSEKSERKKVLEEAIRFEIDGREFFLKSVEKAKTYIAKVIFQTIADEELDHIRKVKKIYESDVDSENQENLYSVSEKKNLQNIFKEAKEKMGQGFNVNADEMGAIRLAIQLEFKGHEFYSRLAQEAISDFEKNFYQHLAEEELVHFSALRQLEEAMMDSNSFR